MKKVREQFLIRQKEIETYFDFLKTFDYDDVILNFSDKGLKKTYKIDKSLPKILKANGFLLIYNFVEAITRLTLIEYLNSISKSKVSFKKLQDQIQNLWLRNKLFADNNIGNKSNEMIFQELYKEVISNTFIQFTTELKNDNGEVIKEFVKLSGNVNAKTIRKLALKYGFDSTVGALHEKAGADLDEIKNKRNYLAHGILTFIECGSKVSVPDMCKYKDNALMYLDKIITNIEANIKDKKFKK